MQEQLLRLADLGASWILWLLLTLSVVAVAIVLERSLYFFRTRSTAQSTGSSFEAETIRAGRAAVQHGKETTERRMASALQRLQGEASSRLTFLGTVGSNAPFVGLLGTVIGIVRAFQELDASRGQVTAGLMSEVGEALIATAVGILVALPAVAFYNFFQGLIRARVERAESAAQDFLAELAADASTSGAK